MNNLVLVIIWVLVWLGVVDWRIFAGGWRFWGIYSLVMLYGGILLN